MLVKQLLPRLSREFRRNMATKIDPVKLKHLLTPEREALVDIFKRHNFEIRIAGGAVRDLLMGSQIPDDIDFATTATPTEMKNMFETEGIRMINMQGEKHGTITARINDKENFEVTTLRIDKVTDGRRAEVEFTRDWEVDAARRDLTVNSMFLSLSDGQIYDFFNGQEDLKNRRIRFVGDAEARIQEDYLRILRYFRFYGRLVPDGNDNHEEETLKAIRDNVQGMERISGERIWSEWKKILSGKMGGPLTKTMIECGLGPYIGLPSDPNVQELDRIWSMHKNSLHSVTLLTSLLKSEDDMTQLNSRLKMSGFERDLGIYVINNRGLAPEVGNLKHWQKNLLFIKKRRPEDLREWIVQTLVYDGDKAEILERFRGWEPPRFPVTGSDLKEAGLPPGEAIGFCLTKLKELWLDSDYKLTKEEMLLKDNLDKVTDEVLKDMPVKSPKGMKRKKSG